VLLLLLQQLLLQREQVLYDNSLIRAVVAAEHCFTTASEPSRHRFTMAIQMYRPVAANWWPPSRCLLLLLLLLLLHTASPFRRLTAKQALLHNGHADVQTFCCCCCSSSRCRLA
jgi:hypothetical protein